jgi:hypothetical protein
VRRCRESSSLPFVNRFGATRESEGDVTRDDEVRSRGAMTRCDHEVRSRGLMTRLDNEGRARGPMTRLDNDARQRARSRGAMTTHNRDARRASAGRSVGDVPTGSPPQRSASGLSSKHHAPGYGQSASSHVASSPW